METGKALVASYYGVDGYNITFTTELQLAVSSLVGVAGVDRHVASGQQASR